MHFKYKNTIKVNICKGYEKIYHVDSKHKKVGEIILILDKILRELLDPERNISYEKMVKTVGRYSVNVYVPNNIIPKI